MLPPLFDRFRIVRKPLAQRTNRVTVARDLVEPTQAPHPLSAAASAAVAEVAVWLRDARASKRPAILATGAHAIKNGLAPVLVALMEKGWITHLATNGAGIIHDWELAWLGETSEHVQRNIEKGEFGTWEETGFHINLALAVGAFEGCGYGESVGKMIETEGLDIPASETLESIARTALASDPARAAAAADLLGIVRRFSLKPGRLEIPHRWKPTSVQAAAFRLGVPFTSHPMFGHDIIYTHPMSCGAAIGRAAERDFLAFVASVSALEGGVYLSIGSAVMSPMIFEKALSMARNVARQEGRSLVRHRIAVVDLAKSAWDWTRGEPSEDHPDYYLRFNKSFHRMGGTLRYLSLDNRDFLLALWRTLEE
ncbi:MAG: hypothetical protein IT578_03890 [Verrucomicrobiae bacterium]|nr:hypothetical protein [Verrucomicrobiae bacterium]